MFMPMMMMMMRMMMTTMVMRLLPLTVKILSIEMSLKRGLNKGNLGTFERDIDDNETLDCSELDADNVISVQNITNIIPAYCHFLQILGKIWLILHILRYHLCLLGERG